MKLYRYYIFVKEVGRLRWRAYSWTGDWSYSRRGYALWFLSKEEAEEKLKDAKNNTRLRVIDWQIRKFAA